MTDTLVLTKSVTETYLNSKFALTTELTQIYQCPLDIKATAVLLCHAASVDDLNDGSLSVCWADYNDENFMTYFIYNGNLPSRSGLNVLYGKFFLEAGDSIWAKADALDRIHLTLSLLEIS
jgi:hypothetical protein